jgi:hypothetical protein
MGMHWMLGFRPGRPRWCRPPTPPWRSGCPWVRRPCRRRRGGCWRGCAQGPAGDGSPTAGCCCVRGGELPIPWSAHLPHSPGCCPRASSGLGSALGDPGRGGISRLTSPPAAHGAVQGWRRVQFQRGSGTPWSRAPASPGPPVSAMDSASCLPRTGEPAVPWRHSENGSQRGALVSRAPAAWARARAMWRPRAPWTPRRTMPPPCADGMTGGGLVRGRRGGFWVRGPPGDRAAPSRAGVRWARVVRATPGSPLPAPGPLCHSVVRSATCPRRVARVGHPYGCMAPAGGARWSSPFARASRHAARVRWRMWTALFPDAPARRRGNGGGVQEKPLGPGRRRLPRAAAHAGEGVCRGAARCLGHRPTAFPDERMGCPRTRAPRVSRNGGAGGGCRPCAR